MSKVFISRTDGNVPWGFRLQGGLEDNEPLILSHIQPNSPADGKIDPGDTLIEIAGTNVIQMTHKDVLELIRSCGDALLLTIHKVGHAYPSGSTQIRKTLSPQQSYDYDQSPALSHPMAHTPVAPTFNGHLIDQAAAPFKNRPGMSEYHTTYEQTTEFSTMPAVLAKSLGWSGGPKPFSYTPGGLDLSKLLDLARNRRQRQSRSSSEATKDIEQSMNRRMIVPTEQMNQHHYAGVNPIIPFSYARQQPTPPKKHIQHDTDAVTQSRAFQLLEGWITDSEKTIAALVPPSSSSSSSAVARAVVDEQNNVSRRSNGQTSLPSRSFRYLQEQYNTDQPTTITTTTKVEETITSRDSHGGLRRSSDAYTPSRSFKHLQSQYATSEQALTNRSQTVNNRDDLIEIYNKPPPSFRAREPEAPRYTGSTVPSRSFRFLQKMTEDDQQIDSESVTGYSRPHQSPLHKYDEETLSRNSNRFNEHPSRSFKYLQEITGEQPSTGRRMGSLSSEIRSTEIGATDF